MLGPLEEHRPQNPNRDKQENSKSAPYDNAGEKSGQTAKPAKWHRGKLRRKQTQRRGNQDGREVHAAADNAGAPTAPDLPQQKKDTREDERRLPEWRTVLHGHYRGKQSCARWRRA